MDEARPGTRRLALLALAGLASVCLWVGRAQAQGAVPALRDLRFDVVRNGKVVGHHDVTFHTQGGKLVVDIDVSIKVDAMFVTVFRFVQKREEVWQGGRLVSFTSHTNDDGELYDNAGEAEPQGLKVTSGRANWIAPADSLPISYWDMEMVKRGPLLDTVTGKAIVAGARALGRETIEAGKRKVIATHYVFEGPQPRELWYDADGRWVKMRANGRDGSIVDWILK